MRKLALSIICTLALAPPALIVAQQLDPTLTGDLHWRSIGPYRGGRTRAACGVPTQPNVFYVGAVNGGVWKSNDYGRTWDPIFDHEPTGSIGAIAVSPSNPHIVYVGSGEGLHRPDLSVGDGIYKSTDAGAHWRHLGLRDGQQISQMSVDPNNPDRLFVAVAGHPYGPNPERGIFRSVDGGRTFQKVLYKDEKTGAAGVRIDPQDPNTVYATLWEAREGPWENAAWNGTGGGIYKSTDGGDTWHQLGGGLPTGIIQAYVAIAASAHERLFASVATKGEVRLYRSSDGGASWTQATTDPRPATRIGGGDLPVPAIDPKNPDVVYMTSIVTWRSTDGGRSWTGIRGAPGGDDYQNIWINPINPEIILLVSDQGALVTVNRGETWSSWYNQPTAQLYHVNADNAFPYRVCSGQQESGSVCIKTRANDGEITFRDWHPVAAEEYGYVVPDPLDPDVVYGGKLTRYDRRTGQAQNIMPEPFRSPDFRVVRTEPIVFSPTDPHLLYFAANTLWSTRDGGKTWKQISPDLSRQNPEVPASFGQHPPETAPKQDRRGVIYALAPSPLQSGLIWAGTDDGLIWRTDDSGAHWTNLSSANLSAWQKVSIIEAGHFDATTAYAAINTLRLDDLRPHILRTHDAGKTWTEIVAGIPQDENVNAIREDPERKGLLYAATERAVYVSFDDGDHWQSLRLNMPATSVRDLLVKNGDLVAATHGRGFWILDDISPLRQINADVLSGKAHLLKLQNAYRVRWDMNTDTPLPPDEPAGQNPPDGVVLDYYLPAAASQVTLEIHDAAGKLVRRYSSSDVEHENLAKLPIPAYWVRPPQHLSVAAGLHRFLWDMHYQPVAGLAPEYPIAAVYRNTAPVATSPWALPGSYSVTLTADAQSSTEPITIVMDPRVKTAAADLQAQFDLSRQAYEDVEAIQPAIGRADSLHEQIDAVRKNPASRPAAEVLEHLEKSLESVAGGETRAAAADRTAALRPLRTALMQIFWALQDADVAPTAAMRDALPPLHAAVAPLLERWKQVETMDLPACNQQLRKAGLPELKPERPPAQPDATFQDEDEGM